MICNSPIGCYNKSMCLAIPGKIKSINEDKVAEVNFDGVIRTASLDMLPKAKIGDYVLVHAGFAIEVVDENEAQKTLDLLKELI